MKFQIKYYTSCPFPLLKEALAKRFCNLINPFSDSKLIIKII